MEIVLQWLDELDDLVLIVAALWRGACRLCLGPGLLAAVILTPLYGADLHAQSVMFLSAVAIGSVLAWFTALLPAMKTPSSQATSAA